MFFYSTDPSVQSLERQARRARAAFVAGLVRRLGRAVAGRPRTAPGRAVCHG